MIEFIGWGCFAFLLSIVIAAYSYKDFTIKLLGGYTGVEYINKPVACVKDNVAISESFKDGCRHATIASKNEELGNLIELHKLSKTGCRMITHLETAVQKANREALELENANN